MAQVVVAVAQQNNRAAHRAGLLLLEQFVAAGKVERVIHRGAAARPQHAHADRKMFGAVGEILGHFGSGVEADHECLVIARANDGIQKFDGCFLLELEAVAHRVARVDQQSNLQRQIGFTAEAAQFGRLLVVDDLEVVFLQILDVAPVPVGHREDDANFVDRFRECSEWSRRNRTLRNLG